HRINPDQVADQADDHPRVGGSLDEAVSDVDDPGGAAHVGVKGGDVVADDGVFDANHGGREAGDLVHGEAASRDAGDVAGDGAVEDVGVGGDGDPAADAAGDVGGDGGVLDRQHLQARRDAAAAAARDV